MDAVEIRTCYLRRANRSWNIHLHSLSNHLNGKTRSREMGLGGVLIEKKRCYNDQVDFKYTRMWIAHKPATTKDEDCRIDTNRGYNILKWNTMQ
jgi:hypothetical protein